MGAKDTTQEPEAQDGRGYSAAVLGEERGGVGESREVPDFTPRSPAPREDNDAKPVTDGAEQAPAAAQQAAQQAAQESLNAGNAETFEIGGRTFAMTPEGLREAATAWHEAQQYISRTRRADPGEEEEYDEDDELEEEAGGYAPALGEPTTLAEAMAWSERDPEAAARWAITNQANLRPEAFDDVVNAFYAVNPAGCNRLLNEQRAQQTQRAIDAAARPAYEAQARSATTGALSIMRNWVGDEELQRYAPALNAAISRGEILTNPETATDPMALSAELYEAYRSIKGSEIIGGVQTGKITLEQAQQMLAAFAPQQAPQDALRPAPAASSAHTTQIASSSNGANEQRLSPKEAYAAAVLGSRATI